jgi:hypothetical protein
MLPGFPVFLPRRYDRTDGTTAPTASPLFLQNADISTRSFGTTFFFRQLKRHTDEQYLVPESSGGPNCGAPFRTSRGIYHNQVVKGE